MQMFLQTVAFSLQTDGCGQRPVLTKGKRPKSLLPISNNKLRGRVSVIFSFNWVNAAVCPFSRNGIWGQFDTSNYWTLSGFQLSVELK